MDGLGKVIGGFCHPSGCSTSRSGELETYFLRLQDGDEGLKDGGLSGAGATRKDGNLGGKGGPQTLGLFVGKAETGFFLRPLDGLVDEDGR